MASSNSLEVVLTPEPPFLERAQQFSAPILVKFLAFKLIAL